jgi:diguanylate cyclase (GGDEF)-like protein
MKNFAVADAIYGDRDMHVNTVHTCSDERLFEWCLNEVPLLLVILDNRGRVVWINRKAVELTGFDNRTAQGEVWFDQSAVAAMYEEAYSDQEKPRITNLVIPAKEGSDRVVSGKLMPVGSYGSSMDHVVFVASSVCEGADDDEACLTGYDELTGLAGRAMAYEQIKHAMAKAKRKNTRVGVIFLDVDDFKKINDTLGHAAGDAVLSVVASRLQNSIRESDTVARIGGDEFLVILNEIEGAIDCEVVAEKVVELFSLPVDVDGESVSVTTSMGISIYPWDGVTRENLVANADAAMYYAKSSGKNRFHFFTNEINTTIQNRLTLESRLRDAVKAESFAVLFQPIVEAGTGKVVGVESLVRWVDEGKLVSPSEFLSVAEDSGLILPIGEEVMRVACRDAVAWSRTAGEEISVTVNLSLRQLLSGHMPMLVRSVIEESGIEPGNLLLELTELSLLYKFDYMREQLSLLHEMGVRLSLDDFGVGYSSLSCIDNIPLSTVKIDGSRVHGLSRKGSGLAFCDAVTSMTHSFSKKVVAEAVESSRQLRYLRGIGVDYVQGSYISEPLHRDAVSHIFS